MASKTKLLTSETTYTTDGQGELLSMEHREVSQTIVRQEPPYIKLYIQDVLYMQDMPKGLTNIVYALLRYANYANQGLQIFLPLGLKNKLIAELDTTKAVFNNALTKLCKGNIIRRVDVGIYELNPYFFGRGEWKDIDKLRMTWNYDEINGKTFQGVITYKDGTSEPTGDAATESESDRLNAEERADRERIAV